MEIFRTLVHPSSINQKISYDSKMLFLGSCFTENIGCFFRDSKFDVDINPFGIQYNPDSITQSLARIISGKPYEESDLFYFQERWHSFDHHSSFSNINKEACLDSINARLAKANATISKLTHLFVTFGTNYCFRSIKTGEIVNNCHKVDAKEFKRIELSINEMFDMITPAFSRVKSLNENLQIVLTVSPIRYVQQGFVENTFSKAKLFSTIDLLQREAANLYYFPAYEIVIDDLRDYRFYKEDMIHPNDDALRYVWLRLKNAMLENTCFKIIEEVDSIDKDLRHRPNLPFGEAHQSFLRGVQSKILQLNNRFPLLDFEIEKAFIQEKLC